MTYISRSNIKSTECAKDIIRALITTKDEALDGLRMKLSVMLLNKDKKSYDRLVDIMVAYIQPTVEGYAELAHSIVKEMKESGEIVHSNKYLKAHVVRLTNMLRQTADLLDAPHGNKDNIIKDKKD